MKPNCGRCSLFVNLQGPLTIGDAQARVGARFRDAFVRDNFRAFFSDTWMNGTNLGARP
jgi:hypothetical protein